MPQGERINSDEIIDRLQKNNVLTHNGKPFHAVMDIKEEKGDPGYNGRIELSWLSPEKYRLVLTSHDFDQTLIVNGPQVQETDRGDFYPGWLHGFVTALLDPMPRIKDFEDGSRQMTIGPHMHNCFRRDDRPGGITDQMTWGQICFADEAPNLDFVIDFTYNMEFHDYKKFGKKQIARTYITGEADHARIHGTLATLEELKSMDESLFQITKPTPPEQRIHTTLVSTLKEESMVESKPADVSWPPVREGKLDGFMIVQAITDRTGQVRETSKHNSDNAELESFGRLVALKYKFQPLVVDGIPQQMAMPLVLHFVTTLGEPYPEFDDAATRKRAQNCQLPTSVSEPKYAGQSVELLLTIGENGSVAEAHEVGGKFSFALYRVVSDCHFEPLNQNGHPTRYKGHIHAEATK